MAGKLETYKATRWRITYTNAIGREYNIRYHYADIIFESKASADRECALLIKHHNPERSTNEDYKVEEFVANLLVKPLAIE
jgi:hypothetical protein